MESQLFVSIDGNGIGKQIESYILTNSFDELKRFSQGVISAIGEISGVIEFHNGRVIMAGGDNILATIPVGCLDDILSAVKQINSPGLQFAVGIGATACDAYLALKYAKARNATCIRYTAQMGFCDVANGRLQPKNGTGS